MATRGIDVHQDKGDPDWAKVKAAGYSFAWLKVSEGVGFPATDEWYRRNRKAARAAGLRVGGYHYLTIKGGGSTPAQESAFFLGRLKLEPGDLLPSATTSRSPLRPERRKAPRSERAVVLPARGTTSSRRRARSQAASKGDVDLNELRGDDLGRITYRRSEPAVAKVRFELVRNGRVVKASAPVKEGAVRERLALQTFLLLNAARIRSLTAAAGVTVRRRAVD